MKANVAERPFSKSRAQIFESRRKKEEEKTRNLFPIFHPIQFRFSTSAQSSHGNGNALQ